MPRLRTEPRYLRDMLGRRTLDYQNTRILASESLPPASLGVLSLEVVELDLK